MSRERRVFNFLPEYLKTPQNNRETFVADDILYEPEDAEFVNGYIGDSSILTAEDLDRTPPVEENSAERQKYQLVVGAAYIDPNSGQYVNGSFYQDLVNQIEANGGIVSDPNRLFETPFYAWTPPIDYDKHVNFSRYFWTGEGSADVNGEYVTKEPYGSQVVLYRFNGTTFDRVDVEIVNGLPSSAITGDIVEDVSTPDRLLYQWNGSSWGSVSYTVVPSIPTNLSSLVSGTYWYVTRTGPEFQRPLMWQYSASAGRWIAMPVVVSEEEPEFARPNMLWEDSRVNPYRRIRRYENGVWVSFSWSPAPGPSGVGTDGEYILDTRSLGSLSDPWATENWWRHYEDLSPSDREALGTNDQAIRPILELWNGIEAAPGDAKEERNDAPQFRMYAYNRATDQIQPVTDANFPGAGTQGTTTIYQYKVGIGQDDLVLGFPLSFNQSGEFQFDVDLELKEVNLTSGPLEGYRFFRDSITGFLHSIWAKSDVLTQQNRDSYGLYEIPRSINSNANHEVLTTASRSKILSHISGILRSQDGFDGNEFGLNNYRWTGKNPTVGSSIIDCENTLLRALATIQNQQTNIPDVIRGVSKDYNRVLFKFVNKLNQGWDSLEFNDPAGTLLLTPAEVVDGVLTQLFIGRGQDFPYYRSGMGMWIETQISGGVATVIDPDPKPIYIPSSPARIGTSPAYLPSRFEDRDGTVYLRGHDGHTIEAFGDGRDDVWLELQNRFYNEIPDYFKTETATFSTRFTPSNFFVSDYYGNYAPETSVEPVDEVVNDFNTIPMPMSSQRVFSTSQGVYAVYDGAKWLTRPALVDDTFLSIADGEYYTFNGFNAYQIDRFNRPFTFDYTTNEFRIVIRREFERWAAFRDVDFVENNQFDQNDPFTWNYSSAGVEGHYQGQYRRLYNTIRPHSHPWEVVGYTIEPDWWRTQYVPDSTASDGTPRYGNAHPMWTDFQNGIVNPISGQQLDRFILTAPVPVDANGELLDPIAAGVVDQESLDQQRLDDNWVFGDGSPVEQDFYDSPYWGFALALAGYLMKPGIWIDPVWSLLYIDIGEDQLWRGPHVVHTDTLTRPKIADLPIHLTEDEDGNTITRLGIQSWISERVQISGGSPERNFAKIIRNTTPSLAWKTAGYINPARTNIFTLSGVKIPFEDIHPILHRSPPVREEFCSGVMIAREDTGYRVYGFDLFNPFFRIELPAIPRVGGEVELREEIVAEENQHEFEVTQFTLPNSVQDSDTAKFAVVVNGLRLRPQFINIESKTQFSIEDIVEINAGYVVAVSVVTTKSNPSTQIRRFSIDGVSFNYFASGSGQFADIEYGRFFETSTDVINFMIGYGRALEKAGWVFDYQADDGTIQDWINGAKNFARWVLQIEAPWNPDGIPLDQYEAFYYSPIRREAKFRSEFGQVLNVESLQYGAYGVLDANALPMEQDEVFTSRVGDEITLTTTGQRGIYGARVYVSEYQHIVFFSNVTKFNDLIYDPVLSLAQSTLRVDTYRTANWNGRLEANGFVISGGDLLPNFEKQAKDFTRFYDRINPVDDPERRDQARNLYGFVPNDEYMDPIGADDRSKFNYYRGMIQTKGTIRPIVAFTKGTRIGQDNFFLYEDWAWKLCEYGDVRRDIVQFRVDKIDFREQLQVIKFENQEVIGDNVIEVLPFDRSTPDRDTRWILPPVLGEDQCCNYTFPVTPAGIPDVERTRFYSKLFDLDNGFTVLRHFHFDPELDRFEPEAFAQIDYRTFYDPARYTNGPGRATSNELAWGEEHVNQYWWDTRRFKLLDYRNANIPSSEKAQFWGKLLYYNANITRVDEIATVQTLDPVTGHVVPHNLTDGDRIEIRGADQEEYNRKLEVVVTSPSEFQFEVDAETVTPATGQIRVQVGFIDILQWVKSPVPPADWAEYLETLDETDLETPTGIVDDPLNTSYVEQTEFNPQGRPSTVFYFWIRSNAVQNPIKDFSADETSRRLSDPTARNIPWFAPLSQTEMVMFTDGERVRDNYAIELIQDQRELETHIEWALLSENDQFRDIPDDVVNKLFDSMAGRDRFGETVPSDLLSPLERYGNEFFPIQTVFRNRQEAVRAFVTAINELLKNVNLRTSTNLLGIFPLADEGTYWNRTNFIEDQYENEKVLDDLATATQRDNRLAQGFYIEGDIVKVKQSPNTDPWDGSQVPTTYRYDGSNWIEIGVDNSTASINENIGNTYTTFRRVFYGVYELLSTLEQNRLVFTLLYEMLRQNPNCDWFFKTSYVSIQVFSTASRSPFVLPDEVEAIVNNIEDVKPYRTKLRSNTVTYTVEEIEQFPVNLLEFPDKKITLLFDRLACDLTQDGGWDAFAWNTEEEGWDKPFWFYADLGRDERFSLGTQVGDSMSTSFTFPSPYDPKLYEHTVHVFDGSGEVIPEDLGLTFNLIKSHTDVTVTFNTTLPPSFTVELRQSRGFYQGGTPRLGGDLDESFRVTPSTYEHHVARTLVPGEYNPADEMTGCPMDTPEERIETGVVDSVQICVKTDWTQAYNGWDTTPWDTTKWDRGPDDIGRRVFIISVGNQSTIPPGNVWFQTSDDVNVGSTPFVIAPSDEFNIVQIELNSTVLTEGTDFEFVEPFAHIIRLIAFEDITYTADGATTSFDASAVINGVSQVFVNNTLQTIGVDYNVVGNQIQFVQPAPTLIPIESYTRGRVYQGDDFSQNFETGLPFDSLAESSVFPFENGVLLNSATEYDLNPPVSDIQLSSALSIGDELITFTIGNDIADNDRILAQYIQTGDSVQDTYNVGLNSSSLTSFVFLDGVYQVLGINYTIPSNGTVMFTSPPLNGQRIEIRVFNPAHYVSLDLEHIVFNASGTSSDPIPGLNDASPNRMMVFVGSQIQDGYATTTTPDFTLSNGNPDVINWVGTPPTAGTPITVRFFRQIVIDQTSVINVVPVAGDQIRIVPNPKFVAGDTVRFIYNGWPVGPLGRFRVVSAPEDFDVADEVLTLNSTIPAPNNLINVNYLVNRAGESPRSILVRFSIIVNEYRADHTDYTVNGFDTNINDMNPVIVNTTDDTIYQWDGSTWQNIGTLNPGDQFYSTRQQQIVEFDGTSYNVLFNVGDSYTTPPVLNYPLFGRGIVSATYALGQLNDASTNFPDAYEVIQHPGDC